ncbi:MAG: agmatinase [Candidatus Thermoplasmatota archaeon]|nr:agmatinase [Candidatus Thermoplasmatota archaeon]
MTKSFPSDIPSYFADAEASLSDSELVLFGVTFDKTASFRSGARFGPESIRKASWNFESYNFHTNVDLQNHHIHDYGNLDINNDMSSSTMIKQVQQFSTSLIEKRKKPILIGGEHSITAGVVQALPKDTCVLCLDAHADYRETYQRQRYNHACTLKRITDHVGSDHVFLCGLRSAGKQEYNKMIQQNIPISDVYSFYEKGKKHVIKDIKSKFKHELVYITIDVDVFDPSFAPGTGTLEPFGLYPLDVLSIIDTISDQIIGFDLMEVNPLFDYGQTSFLAAKIIRHTMERLLKND